MHIPSRTFLRGLGATLALPLLDSMVPASTALAQTAAAPRIRLGFCFMPHGAVMANWTPAAEGALKLSPILAPLEPYKDQVVVLSNLAHAMAGPQGPGDNGGDHTRCPAVFLNGVHPKRTDGADILRRRDDRSDGRGEDRPGHAAAVARTRDRGLQRPRRIVRRRVQLHLHEHDFLAHADVADADGDQPARGLRSDVRRRRDRGRNGGAASTRSAAFSMR